jgi:hypothetical protein
VAGSTIVSLHETIAILQNSYHIKTDINPVLHHIVFELMLELTLVVIPMPCSTLHQYDSILIGRMSVTPLNCCIGNQHISTLWPLLLLQLLLHALTTLV